MHMRERERPLFRWSYEGQMNLRRKMLLLLLAILTGIWYHVVDMRLFLLPRLNLVLMLPICRLALTLVLTARAAAIRLNSNALLMPA
jgi:hypothetical protein